MKIIFTISLMLILTCLPAFAQNDDDYDYQIRQEGNYIVYKDKDTVRKTHFGRVWKEFNIANRWAWGLRYGSVEASGKGRNIDSTGSINAAYCFSNNLAFELEYGYLAKEFIDIAYKGIFLNIQVRYPLENLAFYTVSGFGFQNYKDNFVFDNPGDSFATKWGLGAEHFLKRNYAINTEITYTFAGNASFDSWEWRIGAKYYFDEVW